MAVSSVRSAGFNLQTVKMNFRAGNIMTLSYGFTNNAGSSYLAEADYTMTAAGIATLKLAATQPSTATYGNMEFLSEELEPVNNYFSNNKFKIDWINQLIPGDIGVPGSAGAFYKQTDPKSYFYGALGQ